MAALKTTLHKCELIGTKRKLEESPPSICKIGRLSPRKVDDRLFQGDNDTQVSEGGEADLLKHFENCTKNPDHRQFIPVDTFSINHLPSGYRDKDLYELIKATIDLTVRVGVKMTSPHRPKFWPETKVQYPFYNMRNKTTQRLGSGQMRVKKFIDGRGAGHDLDDDGKICLSLNDPSTTRTCPCTKCQHSDKPNNVWWEFIVNTATHVVFDDIEASHTTCRLFYDKHDSPVVSLDKVSFSYGDIEEDISQLKYVTCDSLLGDKLYKMEVQSAGLWRKILDKYKNKSDVRLTFIVSHPHGYHKYVSFGVWREIGIHDANYEISYTASTCSGSSGAPVFCLGQFQNDVSVSREKIDTEGKKEIQKFPKNPGLVRFKPAKIINKKHKFDHYFDPEIFHLSKATSKLKVKPDFKFIIPQRPKPYGILRKLKVQAKLKSKRNAMMFFEAGQSEKRQECHSNTELKEKYKIKGENLSSIDCHVHPGHKHFKDLSSFSLTDLPDSYQKPQMEELIKALADLTVMVIDAKMECTALENPNNETQLHKTDFVYGTGKVDEVAFHKDEDCPCVECEKSGKKAREWAEVKIVTTSQFLKDGLDVTKLENIFFYDDDQQLDKVKCLTGSKVAMVNNERKVCIFTCFSCDTDLNVMLDKMLDRLEECWENAFDMFATSVKWEKEKLIVIVSHPHGCKKYISIGKRVEGNETRGSKNIFYDTPTCLGSCGAFVMVPDFDVVDEIL